MATPMRARRAQLCTLVVVLLGRVVGGQLRDEAFPLGRDLGIERVVGALASVVVELLLHRSLGLQRRQDDGMKALVII